MVQDETRVLVVGAQFPFPPRSGFETRFSQLVRQAARRHRVTLLAYGQDDDLAAAEELRGELAVEVVRRAPSRTLAKRGRQLGSLLSLVPYAAREIRSPELQAALDLVARSERFDIVQLESVFLWGLRLPPGARVVLDEHNVEYEVFARMRETDRSRARRAFYALEEARTRRLEQRAWRRADGCVVTSEREQLILEEHAGQTPTVVVPNAVDVDFFAPSGVEVEPATMVFNGVLDYRPNVDAVEFLVDEILPRVRAREPEATLTIVGRGDPAALDHLRRDGVVVTGEVPDVRPYLERAAVVLVPIRMGGGTRLKVVEGLALERPMVSTSLGCEGIAVHDGEHLLVADDGEAFAAAVLRLFADAELAASLGRAGRKLMVDRYSWDAAGERLEDLYRTVLGR